MDGTYSRYDNSYLTRDEVDAGTTHQPASESAASSVTPAGSGSKRDKSREGSSSDTHPSDTFGSSLTRKPTYKEQRIRYKVEKKRLTDEILQCFAESTFLLESGWLKARTTIKTWTKIWCELKPGGMILYRNERINENGVWIGTILLNICRIIQRPSKKEGFCFKIYHPLEQSIWASKGPHAELFKGFIVPLPENHVIFRAANDVRGKEWLSSTELVVKHSPDYFTSQQGNSPNSAKDSVRRSTSSEGNGTRTALERMQSEPGGGVSLVDMSPHDITDSTFADDVHWAGDTDSPEEEEDDDAGSANGEDLKMVPVVPPTEELINETSYSVHHQEELGQHGKGLEEKLPEEDRSIFWHLLLQVRPGMDLSKVVLPTFILDPRSLLDKLSDYYYHCDILASATQCESPFERMKGLVVWYLSGFYKKPKGVKKPYNPILGECFRCVWDHPGDSPSRTFYIAEQVSHHPPITAFHVSNRREGYSINGGILTRSKYKGNSIQAILDGTARLKLLSRGEEYHITFPHLICKGMLFGKLSMDLGGKVTIACPTTGYSAELNFSVWLTRTVNPLEGKIKLGNEVMATLQGSWDGEIFLTDSKTKETDLCWKPLPDQRLRRSTVALEKQEQFESEKLWNNVTLALGDCNQQDATRWKTELEDNQREAAKQRIAKHETWTPRLFVQDESGDWIYRHADNRPWDPLLDLYQYEKDFVIQTKLRQQRSVFAAVESPSSSTLDPNHISSNAIKMTTSPRHASQRRRRTPLTQRSNSDSSSGGDTKNRAVAATEGALTTTMSAGIDLILSRVQVIHSEQGQLIKDVRDLRQSLQLKSPLSVNSKIDAVTRKFEYLLWMAVGLGAVCFYLLVFQSGRVTSTL